ncbi:hypothetical protein J1N35_027711 [Gossypium stocksii]|uniref:Uncharacterized protein n=1 Tax=Gossypium stocksii TaxID=47602 RepID=A0A9D3VBY4_9ROSI|nr:hypothetical protein J1N35_027711 [Gossypium stocksii]
MEYFITGVFHSGLKQRFLGISIPFPHHRLAIRCLKYPILPLPKFHLKNTQSPAISRTLRLRHSSPSSKVRNFLFLISDCESEMGLGLSVLIAMKATTRIFGFIVLAIPLLYASLISWLVSIASHPSIDLPMLLGKNPDGTFPILCTIMFSPYLYFARAFSMARRFLSGVYLKGYNAALKKEIPVLSLFPCHFKLIANDKAIGNRLEMLDGHKTHRSQSSLLISGSGTSKWTGRCI